MGEQRLGPAAEAPATLQLGERPDEYRIEKGLVDGHVVVRRDEIQAPGPQPEVPQAQQPAEATTPADRLRATGLGKGTNDRTDARGRTQSNSSC